MAPDQKRQYREYDHQYDGIPVLANTSSLDTPTSQISSVYASQRPRIPARPLIDRVTNEWQKKIPKHRRQKSNGAAPLAARVELSESAPLAGRYKYTSDSDGEFDSDGDDSSAMSYDDYGIDDFDPEHPCAELVYPFSLLASKRYRNYVYCAFLGFCMLYIAWWMLLRPILEERRAIALSFRERTDRWGQNKRPAVGGNVELEFAGLKPVEELDDSKKLKGTRNLHEGIGKDRLIFVGDVHGCYDELSALITKISFNPTTDHLIFTGDLITKGPESSAVLATAMSLDASSVRGNHEDRVLLSLAHLEEYSSPPSKKEDKHTRLARQLPAAQIEYIQSFPVILDVGIIPGLGKTLVVHAGLIPGVPIEKQDPFMCMNMRSIDLSTHFGSELRAAPGRRNMKGGLIEWDRMWRYYERKLLPQHLKEEDQQAYAESRTESRWREAWEGHTTVIYGHDSKRGLNLKEWSKGLDSGCTNGGSLTALVVEKVETNAKGEETAKIWTESVLCKGSKKKSKIEKGEEDGDREIPSAEQAWNPRIPGA
ncbi:MAG: hypothetical protein M1821_001627 [Bathelium mastoideum]|nr:MAG: hypothetical protein M1821_001627 [Bathelium mastoideum]